MTGETFFASPVDDKSENIAAAERYNLFELGIQFDPIIYGDYPEVVKEYVLAESLAEGRKKSRLPNFTDDEKRQLKVLTYNLIALLRFSLVFLMVFPVFPVFRAAGVRDQAYLCTPRYRKRNIGVDDLLTLQRYVKSEEGQENLETVKLTPNYDSKRVFSIDQEEEFASYIILWAEMGFGLDTVQVRQLAYQMATRNKIEYPKDWDKEEIAGKDLLYGFRKRNPTLSMRKPEACSKSRASSFTPDNMAVFFDNLKKVITKYPSVLARL
ncbi:Lactase-like protein [Frankliniella fusca]|uniref:Lactase-like protein n=1 Tax=Frankliniella fusca TaxID=407009 RepID=A0AAE1I4G7_9NEOP|nr:Lactase-like protein [Frankliniella fusca]